MSAPNAREALRGEIATLRAQLNRKLKSIACSADAFAVVSDARAFQAVTTVTRDAVDAIGLAGMLAQAVETLERLP